MITATTTDSFYLDRLKRSHAKRANPVGFIDYGHYIARKSFPHPVERTDLGVSYREEEYKGFQLIIVEDHDQWRNVYDKTGEEFKPHNQVDPNEIGGYGSVNDVHSFYAYAWEIGTSMDQQPDLGWSTSGATLAGICVSNSYEKTRKQAIKKLDVYANLKAIRSKLVSLTSNQLWNTQLSAMTPYNAVIGDEVFVQAHGRLREGVIVGTTGARFIVGYLTPSNHVDLKIKVVPLSQIKVRVPQ